MNAATMKRVIIATFTILCLLTAAAQDIIVKKSGDTLRVYDLKINEKFITYRENPGKNSPSKRIGKAKVLSVKKAKGKSVTISQPDPAPAKAKVQLPVSKVEKDTIVYFTEILPQDSARKTAEKPAKEPKGEVTRAVSPDNARLVGLYNSPLAGYGDKEPKKSKAHRAVAIMGVTDSSVLANEDIEVEILVWRVDSIALKTKAHENGLHAKNLLKVTDDGDASATTHCKRFLAERLFKAGFGRLVCRQCYWTQIALTAMHWSNLHLYARRSD